MRIGKPYPSFPMILSDLAKYSMTRSITRPLCDSWGSCFSVCLYSEYNNIGSEAAYDVVDSRQASVTSSSSLPIWNRCEAAATSWRAATAASGLPYRLLNPLAGVDGDRRANFDEDSDVVDRTTLPRVAKRPPSSLIVNSQPSSFNVGGFIAVTLI